MKKLIAAITIACTGVSVFAQGTISVYNISSTFATTTNSTSYGSSLNGVYSTASASGSGAAPTGLNAYYYALLVQSGANTVTSVNPTSASWSLGMMATNYLLAGGIRGAGGSAGSAVAGWAAPSGASYNSTAATEDYYILIGWSANLGSTWSQVEGELASGQWIAAGQFGVSGLGLGSAGGGPNSLTAPNIFGTGVNPGGLTTGITLYSVTVPEPTTMALTALGGAAMLLIRRKK